jgi:hypothetical protein
MNFEYPEDKQYFIDLLANGEDKIFNEKFTYLFDFRDPKTKRAEFNKIRSSIISELIEKYGEICQLKLLDDCEISNNLVIDHYIPLSTNELNKKLRNIKPRSGKKVVSQSFGSNHSDNLLISCSKCNNYKKHRILKINLTK